MKIFTCLLLLFCCALNGTPAQVLIIRHAEKVPDGIDLNVKGLARSKALVPFFMNNPDLLKYGPPVAIYAQRNSDSDPSIRSIQTLQPLADALNLPLNTTFECHQFGELAEAILSNPAYNGKTVLIAWSHHLIPAIAKSLGAYSSPMRWKGQEFDRIWILTFDPSGRVLFKNAPQRLMFGDSQN